MHTLSRAYYQANIDGFLSASDEEILGHLSRGAEVSLDQLQVNAWIDEIAILRQALRGMSGHILLEYAIPRMGRRADVILLFPNLVVVVEFKVGEISYTTHAVDQAYDYALDLKNFHKQSHDKIIVPLLVATEASSKDLFIEQGQDGIVKPIRANRENFGSYLRDLKGTLIGPSVDPNAWNESNYYPTPTIIEAAQALYRGHNVKEISSSGADNLTETEKTITQIVSESKSEKKKSICFITGVPGAGKTLAGLNIANAIHDPDKDEHAVFLSGNGPLVDVLREALARDEVEREKEKGRRLKKNTAETRVKAFIQNIHHFRDDSIASPDAPVEHVAVFDEAQRAWNLEKTESFMKRRKGILGFGMSEPKFLISVLDRHADWATIICLIGGGQEIHTGEAGLEEWFRVIGKYYPEWSVYISDKLFEVDYLDESTHAALSKIQRLEERSDLHLTTCLRTFRAKSVSDFVEALLNGNTKKATEILISTNPEYPILLTRDIAAAKNWLKSEAQGTQRYGIIASSEAQRLKPFGIDVKNSMEPRNWFLNDKCDIRSSYFLEDVATEFQIQGLELDFACVAWDGDLRYNESGWDYFRFLVSSSKWGQIKNVEKRKYLMNTYRVLLTRARQGMVIFVPEGSVEDPTRQPAYYDNTYNYLKKIGIPEL